MAAELRQHASPIYKADLAGVALKPQESRVIAAWLLGRHGVVDEGSWLRLIYAENAIQVRGRSTLRRQANLLKARLGLVSPGILEIIADGTYRETVHACLAAAIKHSRLLGDFMDIVVRREFLLGGRELDQYHWRTFLDECRLRDSNMGEWAPSSIIRIRTTVMGILHEAGIVERGKPAIIKAPSYEDRVIRILEQDQESWCLQCMRYHQ
jgi:hypothetical protein